jgi:hypothetical protein
VRRAFVFVAVLGLGILDFGSPTAEAKNICLLVQAVKQGVTINGRIAYAPPTAFAACGLPVPTSRFTG